MGAVGWWGCGQFCSDMVDNTVRRPAECVQQREHGPAMQLIGKELCVCVCVCVCVSVTTAPRTRAKLSKTVFAPRAVGLAGSNVSGVLRGLCHYR